ncbi:hypothetical protein [Sphingopyxis fribergensis]
MAFAPFPRAGAPNGAMLQCRGAGLTLANRPPHIRRMVWDLGKAMQKKEEFESARLMDFEFRHRVRTTRLLARAYGLDETAWVRASAARDAAGIVDMMAAETGSDRDALLSEYRRCAATARQQIIDERGDPTPHRLG